MASSLEAEIKHKLVAALELKVAPETIDDETPLFGQGLGLDSVDALEVAAMLSLEFGVEIIDSDRAMAILANVRTIAEYVRADRAS